MMLETVNCEGCGQPLEPPAADAPVEAWQAFMRAHDHRQPGEPDPGPCPPWCRFAEVLADTAPRHGYERDARYAGAWTRWHLSSTGPVCIEQVEVRHGEHAEYERPHLFVDESKELTAVEARALAEQLRAAADQMDAL